MKGTTIILIYQLNLDDRIRVGRIFPGKISLESFGDQIIVVTSIKLFLSVLNLSYFCVRVFL